MPDAVVWGKAQQQKYADCHREEGRPSVLEICTSSVGHYVWWTAEV